MSAETLLSPEPPGSCRSIGHVSRSMVCCFAVPHHIQAPHPQPVRAHISSLCPANTAQASINIFLSSDVDSQPNCIPGSCATRFKPKAEVFLRNSLPSFPCSSWQATSSAARITLAPPGKQLSEPGFLPPGGSRSFQLPGWLRFPTFILMPKQTLRREGGATKRARAAFQKQPHAVSLLNCGGAFGGGLRAALTVPQ